MSGRRPNEVTSADGGWRVLFGVARGLHPVSGSPRDISR
jgi:hypothetical protein